GIDGQIPENRSRQRRGTAGLNGELLGSVEGNVAIQSEISTYLAKQILPVEAAVEQCGISIEEAVLGCHRSAHLECTAVKLEHLRKGGVSVELHRLESGYR